MKPLKLIFQAFGPYAGREEIDFGVISEQGLFLICGETGSGKTMMLDAMTFALYGKSSGNGRDDFSAMRCTKADPDTDTIIIFEFENNGEYYHFERRYEKKRTRYTESYHAAKKSLEGDWIPFFENPKARDVNAKAQEIIGLDYDQFRQVIVLPQGQFEKFLTSDSDAKEKILSDIFGEKRWKAVADKMVKSAQARLDELKQRNAAIEGSLREEGCTTIHDLFELYTGKSAELKDAEDSFADADYDKQIDEIQVLLRLAARFKDMHGIEKRAAVLEADKDKQKERIEKLNAANRAENVRAAIRDLDNADRELAGRKKGLSFAETAIVEAEASHKRASEAVKAHDELKAEIDRIGRQAIEYAGKRDDYARIQELKDAYAAKKAGHDKADKNHKRLIDRQGIQTKKAADLQQVYARLREEHDMMLRAYMSGISGELAEQLADGMPCPVCGSTTHPNKAVKSDASFSRDQVEDKKGECDAKYDELQAANQMLEGLSGEVNAAAAELNGIEAELSEAKARYESVALIDGIADSRALEHRISELEKQVNDYNAEHERLLKEEKDKAETLTTAKSNRDNAKNELDNAEKKYKEADDKLAQALAGNGFTNRKEAEDLMLSEAEKVKLQQDISNYDADVKSCNDSLTAIRAELEGKEEPDEVLLSERKKKISDDKDAALKCIVKLGETKERLKSKYDDLETRGRGLEEAILEASEEVSFAGRLRGDTGVSLQRYVLGIMFSSVISAANRMLELVHDGRYRLFRTDEKGSGNKRGLELKVIDKFSDDSSGRFVNTLSGGEKFLVSLALSIGMSTVAQKSGIKIEALFIDEGFGSLDENSIEDAMKVLETVQKANGMVGIISHVQIMRSRIPVKLMVSKSEGTSHITVSVG